MAQLGRYRSEVQMDRTIRRDEWLRNTPSGLVADNPFLYSSREQINEILCRIELFQKILNVSGAIVECGVAQGNGLMLMSYLSLTHEPYAINRRIIGFDSFDGFRGLGANDPEDLSESDFSSISMARLEEAVGLFDCDRPLNHVPRIEIVPGDATSTIPEYVDSHPELTVALLYLDFDIYEPTKAALEYLLPLVCRGGVVVLDEFNYDKFSGETQALKDVLKIEEVELKRFTYAPFLAYFTR